ncbi:trigger factor [Methylicorpusculum oleiharenae]|uniref:trigger factor n=1 Tax=Methylicorpusculum oleiharenae TaxID=1338687 RepID=UPI00135859D1|nr:trigger factor [Methylicorpusculum oleiharenae]MCD2450789.1 trigger factor [Methylicorpusculum oleiharenae]
MQVSVEKTSELSRKMTVSVPEEVVQEKMEDRLKKLAREVKLDGFRPGKVPQHVVKKMYGDRVRGEVTGDLIQSTYYEAIQENNLRPAGYPSIDPLDEAAGFKYTAVFEVYPEISLEGIDQLEITRKHAQIEASDLDAMVEKIRKQKKGWTQVERPSQVEDKITISFTGVCEGENFTDGKVENFQVEIGANQMIPGFEDHLKGLSAGDSKTFEVNFPEQYGNAKLAGKPATFEIEVAKIEEPSYPELDEEFIKSYGIENGDMNAFREDVKANMARELAMALNGQLKNAVMDALFDKIKVTLPSSLVDEEINNLQKPYRENARKQKLNAEDLNLPRDMFEEQAQRRVALGLILAEIIHKNSIKVSPDKVRETIEDMAKSYERPADVVNWYYSDEQRLNEVRQMVLEDQTVEWIVSQAKVADENVSFDAIMTTQQS